MNVILTNIIFIIKKVYLTKKLKINSIKTIIQLIKIFLFNIQNNIIYFI